MSASFKNWMPAGEQGEIFWGDDEYLYVPILHSKVFWTDEGDFNNNYQYVRIEIR